MRYAAIRVLGILGRPIRRCLVANYSVLVLHNFFTHSQQKQHFFTPSGFIRYDRRVYLETANSLWVPPGTPSEEQGNIVSSYFDSGEQSFNPFSLYLVVALLTPWMKHLNNRASSPTRNASNKLSESSKARGAERWQRRVSYRIICEPDPGVIQIYMTYTYSEVHRLLFSRFCGVVGSRTSKSHRVSHPWYSTVRFF